MFFSKTLVCLTTLISLAVAAPVNEAVDNSLDKRWDSKDRSWQHSEWHPSFIDFSRRQIGGAASGKCDLKNAKMPPAPTPLPAVGNGYYLSHVAVGRGTQNYTCDLSNSTAVPAAAGAVAALFNVSCIAADSPALLERLPVISLNLPVPSQNDRKSAAYNDLSGHHYFSDGTTAVFDLDTTLHEYGEGSFKKLTGTPAPADACPGQYYKGDGAVPWLKLIAKDPSKQSMQEVYRINTAGGSPPKSCSGQQAKFTVEYAAEYWFYSK